MSTENETLGSFNFTKENILQLKEFFKKEINSKRRFEEINTIEELFNVLEDRTALTDDVLLNVEPNFRQFVETQRKKPVDCKELVLPRSVVTFICDNYPDEREKFGHQLKLSKEQISQCENVEDILMKFQENCKGISQKEMIFRLNRGLEKCGKEKLKSMVVELMNS